MKKKIFVDSDVVISSLISEKGAAYYLINEQNLNFVISNISQLELKNVVDRLNLSQARLKKLIKEKMRTVKLSGDLDKVKKKFKDYASDPNDVHIVAGAAKAKAKFLLTYNVRDFNRQKINEDFSIVVLTPAQYLQYLRSLD